MNIKSIIYDTLEKDNRPWIPQNHNPSSASFKFANGRVIGKDLLSLYYKWKGIPPSNPKKSQTLFMFKLGDGTHEQVAKILSKANVKVISEVGGKIEISPLKHKISYRVDNLLENNGELEVLEVKSSTDDAMFGWTIAIRNLGPKDDAVLQTVSYLNVVPGLRRARILYVARDTGQMLEFIIERNNDRYIIYNAETKQEIKGWEELTFSGIVSRWAVLEKYLEDNQEPPIEYKVWVNDSGHIYDKQIKGVKHKSDWQAKYSDYCDKIYLDPKNYEFATYNYSFKQKGLI